MKVCKHEAYLIRRAHNKDCSVLGSRLRPHSGKYQKMTAVLSGGNGRNGISNLGLASFRKWGTATRQQHCEATEEPLAQTFRSQHIIAICPYTPNTDIRVKSEMLFRSDGFLKTCFLVYMPVCWNLPGRTKAFAVSRWKARWQLGTASTTFYVWEDSLTLLKNVLPAECGI